MKRSLSIVVAGLLALGLTACSGYSPSAEETPAVASTTAGTPRGETAEPRTRVFVQQLPDGREVLCVWAKDSYDSGGVSCNWEALSTPR